jgi:hypothetical protein
MKASIKVGISVLIVLAFILTSCNLPKPNASNSTPNPDTIKSALTTEAPQVQETSAPAQTAEVSVTESAAVTDSTVPTENPAASETQTPITHLLTPGDPVWNPDQITTDCNTGARLPAGSNQVIISGCDYWNREMLERPAESATGTYIPALDIIWSEAGKYEPWIFLKVNLSNLAQAPKDLKAGFELDPDLDSRGEFLITTNLPSSTAWSTDGVQVWQDTNQDNGGTTAFHYDQNTADGYETLLFDNGKGADADLAWSRISPKNTNIIEFAFKASVLPNQKVFGWWPWVGLQPLTSDKFELVDRAEETTTWNVDNSCSWIFGTKPKPEQLVNLCAVVLPTPTPAPTQPPAPNVPSGCNVTFCRLGFYFDASSCSCKRFIIIIPTNTPIIIK